MRLLLVIILLAIIPSIALTKSDAQGLYIWLPKKMIVGNTYEGIVVSLGASDHEQHIELIPSSDLLSLPKRLTIPPHKNHAIFSITPLSTGNFTVYAINHEEFTSTNINVYDNIADINRLKIIVQEDIKKERVLGYIFLVDNNGIPIESKKDMKIKLVKEEGIRSIDEVVIKKGSYYTSFIARIIDSGSITAVSEDARSATINIKKEKEKIDVRLEIAPKIAHPDSKAYFYLWLEKDNKPFKPEKGLNVILTTSNIEVTSFDKYFKGANSKRSLILDDYFESGEIFTHKTGNATITALIEGIGGDTDNIIVGALLTNSTTITNATDPLRDTFTFNNNRIVSILPDAIATDIFTWVYPSVINTNKDGEGVAALYYIEKSVETQKVTLGRNGTAAVFVTQNVTLISPVINDEENYRVINIASDGLLHTNTLVPDISTNTHAIRFNLRADKEGNYNIIASAMNVLPSTSTLKVIKSDNMKEFLQVLPLKKGIKQPLLMMASKSPSNEFIINSDDPSTDISIEDKDGILVIYGKIEKATNIAITNNREPLIIRLIPDNPILDIELDNPLIVHRGEDYPAVAHIVENGIPLKRINIKNIITNNDNMIVITESGILSKDIETFLNRLRFNIHHDDIVIKNNHTINMNLGDEIMLEMDTNGFIDIYTDIPYRLDDNIIYLKPIKHGNYFMNITASREGYKSEHISINISVKKFINLKIESQGPFTTLEVPIESSIGKISTPYNKRVEVMQFNVTFPQKFNDLDLYRVIIKKNNDTITTTDKVLILYLNDDVDIKAVYGRNIIITVNNGEGSGSYPVGSKVNIVAPDKPIIPFLLKEVLDHWEGLPANYNPNEKSIIIEADENMIVTAVYRVDYLGLLLPIAVVIAIILTNFIRKRKKIIS